MVVLEPLKVTILNFPSTTPTSLQVANFPGDPSKGHHTISLMKEIYIERSDFREVRLNFCPEDVYNYQLLSDTCNHNFLFQKEEKGFRRLTISQPVGLRYANLVISLSEIVRDNSGMVSELKVMCKPIDESEKPKAFIHWVSGPLSVEVRLYENL
jgi:glutaminyl-tRNA synthetase